MRSFGKKLLWGLSQALAVAHAVNVYPTLILLLTVIQSIEGLILTRSLL